MNAIDLVGFLDQRISLITLLAMIFAMSSTGIIT